MKIVIVILISMVLSTMYGLVYYANSKVARPKNCKHHVCDGCNLSCKISEVNHK